MDQSTKQKKPFYQKWWLWAILVIILLAIGGCYWYFQIKVPHDEAVAAYNVAVNDVEEKNALLDAAIQPAQELLDSNAQAFDTQKATDLQLVISNVTESKRIIKEVPKKTENILTLTNELSQPLDYTNDITNIAEKQKALEDSIKQMNQITNPSGDFVIQRLSQIEGIADIQGVTEDNDPNGNLNKQGGYTSTTYFTSTLINQEEVYGNTVIDKGTEAGGAVEVYSTSADAETRNAYLAGFDGSGMLNSGSHYVYGTAVIRTSTKLTATQQNELTESIKNKLIELQ